MVDIPAEVQIKSTIKLGSVFYFIEETFTSEDPHYFIVLNKNPITDINLLMVCASSQIEKVKIRRLNLSVDTLVVIKKDEYADFTKDSIVDCNYVYFYHLDQLINKLKKNMLKLKSYVSEELFEKLRNAVISSPLVENELKKLIS